MRAKQPTHWPLVLGSLFASSLALCLLVFALAPSHPGPLRPLARALSRVAPATATWPTQWSTAFKLTKRAPILAEAKSSIYSIQIDGSLPSTDDPTFIGTELKQVWDDAFESLAVAARNSMGKKNVKGVPGTGIDTDAEARQLQEHLDCMSGNGEWVYDENGDKRQRGSAAGLTVHKHTGVLASCDRTFYRHASSDSNGEWAVRESLKYRWVPSASCAATAPKSATSSPLSRHAFCTMLAHKATVLVGDVPQYELHDLILDWTSLAPFSCYGDLYCKEHLLCADVLRHPSPAEVEDWTPDERVFHRLPNPPNPVQRPSLPRGKKEKNPTHGTMFRYRRADGLRPSTLFTGPTYIHPSTGVREVNQPWLADARRSDVIILNKAPLPFPARGNNATFDEWWDDKKKSSSTAVRLVEAAWKITLDVWLPEMMETLKLLRVRPTPEDILVVYRSSWRAHSDCGVSAMPASSDEDDWNSPGDGPPPHLLPPSLRNILFRQGSSDQSPLLNDVHTTFHNLQTILQNHILRTTVLPTFGIPFLDLESPLAVWRSGLVGGSAASPFVFVDQSHASSDYGHGANAGLRSSASGDCLRYCLPSPGMALEEAFIGGLMRIFERGWGTKDRAEKWVGEGFVDVKQREKEREGQP